MPPSSSSRDVGQRRRARANLGEVAGRDLGAHPPPARCGGHAGRLRRLSAKTQGTRMVGVAPAAWPAPPAEVRELGAAGRAVARGCEARAEGHRRGRGHRLEGVSAHASPPGENPRKRAKLGRVHTIGRRGLPRGQNPRVGPPGRPRMNPWSSCMTDRAPRSWRCRGVRLRLPAARRDRRSGLVPGGERARSRGTSSRAGRARPGALAHSGAAMLGCCRGRCGGRGSTGAHARCSDYLIGS